MVRSSRIVTCLVVLGLAAALPAVAADRRVLIEDFNATWCGPCVPSGTALNWMLDDYPNDIALMQVHLSDGSYTIPWGTSRGNYYSIEGIPNVWMDGTLNFVGAYSDPQTNYNIYEDMLNQRLAVASNYIMTMTAEERTTPAMTYRVTTRVTLEASVGSAKTIRVYMGRLRHHYPTGTHYRNCLRQMPTPDYDQVTINPGQTLSFVRDFTVPAGQAADWNDRPNMRFISWVQNTAGTGKTVVQSQIIAYPFVLPPTPGDMNCDGSINGFDIQGFTTALGSQSEYESQFPDCNYMNADTNTDGSVNSFDIQGFIELLGG